MNARWRQGPGITRRLPLIDLGLPDVSGLEVIRMLHQRLPAVPILVISVIAAEPSLFAAIRAGACGYLLKDDSSASIAHGINDVLNGRFPISPSLARYLFRLAGSPQMHTSDCDLDLTPREQEVLAAIAGGCSYAQVGTRLGVSLSTVQTHIRNLYSKLGAHSQLQAVNEARGRGWLP